MVPPSAAKGALIAWIMASARACPRGLDRMPCMRRRRRQTDEVGGAQAQRDPFLGRFDSAEPAQIRHFCLVVGRASERDELIEAQSMRGQTIVAPQQRPEGYREP